MMPAVLIYDLFTGFHPGRETHWVQGGGVCSLRSVAGRERQVWRRPGRYFPLKTSFSFSKSNYLGHLGTFESYSHACTCILQVLYLFEVFLMWMYSKTCKWWSLMNYVNFIVQHLYLKSIILIVCFQFVITIWQLMDIGVLFGSIPQGRTSGGGSESLGTANPQCRYRESV